MLTDRMSPNEIIKELREDLSWLYSMSLGWHQKYSKELKKKQNRPSRVIDIKDYKTKNGNTITVIFAVDRDFDGKKMYNSLSFWFYPQMRLSNGEKEYIHVSCYDELRFVGCHSFMRFSPHSIQRMKERSGKDFIEMAVDDIESSTHGVMCIQSVEHKGSPSVVGNFGRGIVLGEALDNRGNIIIKTYISHDEAYSNQLQMKLEQVTRCQKSNERFCANFLLMAKNTPFLKRVA